MGNPAMAFIKVGDLMACIQKRRRKNGKLAYTAIVRMRGFPTACKTFDKYGDARVWASNKQLHLEAENQGAAVASKNITADQMIERYIENILEIKSAKKRYIEGQRRQLEWWKGKLKGVRLCNLSPIIINDCKEELAGKNYKTRRPATVNRYIAAINHVINTAIKEWGWIADNPITKITRPKEPKGRIRYLSDLERDRLLNACRTINSKPLNEIVLMALSTGARKSEILKLKRIDIDWHRKVAVAHETKNSEPRQLYLSQSLIDLLTNWINRAPDSDWLFPALRGKSYLCIEKEWRTALRLAGVKDFRFHDLRHTAASYMAMNGASPADIAEALGHKSYDMVKRYAHLSTTHVANVVISMSERFLNTTQEGQQP